MTNQSNSNIDPTWQYASPDELVPYGRGVAQIMGTMFFIGSACKRHPLNHIRYTRGRDCVVCRKMFNQGIPFDED